MIGTHGANTPMDLIQLLLAETMWGWQFKPAKIDDHLLLYGGLLHHFSWWNISCFYVFSGKLHMIHHNVQILLIMTHVCIYLIIYIHIVWMVKTILMIIITIWISIKLYICTIGDAIPQRLPRRKRHRRWNPRRGTDKSTEVKVVVFKSNVAMVWAPGLKQKKNVFLRETTSRDIIDKCW